MWHPNYEMTEIFDEHFANRVVKLCFDHYSTKLASNGKEIGTKKWPHLSAFVISDGGGDQLTVVSMASGSKCIGQTAMDSTGSVLHDSHAEVLSRRALLRYFYGQLMKADDDDSKSIFRAATDRGRFELKAGICLHMMSTCVPCGDAAIFPKNDDGTEEDEPAVKRTKTADIFRTGAKCCPQEAQDGRQPGDRYHVLGALRTKPGRGDPTLSMSCSDKIAKWNALGLQGALLSHFITTPIRISTLTIASARCDLGALKRAVVDRIDSCNIGQSIQLFKVDSFSFPGDAGTAPPPTAFVWSAVPVKPLEFVVNGYKQGATAKSIRKNSPNIRCAVSRYELFKQFDGMRLRWKDVASKDGLSYGECKLAAVTYQEAKARFLCGRFRSWSTKAAATQQFHLHPSTT